MKVHELIYWLAKFDQNAEVVVHDPSAEDQPAVCGLTGHGIREVELTPTDGIGEPVIGLMLGAE